MVLCASAVVCVSAVHAAGAPPRSPPRSKPFSLQRELGRLCDHALLQSRRSLLPTPEQQAQPALALAACVGPDLVILGARCFKTTRGNAVRVDVATAGEVVVVCVGGVVVFQVGGGGVAAGAGDSIRDALDNTTGAASPSWPQVPARTARRGPRRRLVRALRRDLVRLRLLRLLDRVAEIALPVGRFLFLERRPRRNSQRARPVRFCDVFEITFNA
mmetsp:Transcript_49940/g.108202  ORF Transcript_49940/g.108202 Transcript_49940/m.108202 type:complete len:216 (-) Transcript_49940:347-994(-)